MRRWVAAAAVPAALLAGGAALASGHTARATQTGGLALSPTVLQAAPVPGRLGTLTIANRSAAALAVTVTPRPWTESAAGAFAPDRRSALSQVKVDAGSFTLAAGAEQTVAVTLTGAPAGGSLYGALDVTGLPVDAAKRRGVVLGYRLVGTLRLPPAQKRYGLTAGQVKRSGKAVVLPLTSTGNTIDAISGHVSVKGARGTLNDNVAGLRVLPGRKVNLVLATSVRKGSYSATVTLKQGGAKLLTAKRKFSVR
ncbi:hypothetical protein [Candidatus Solirubrobacter pratensis]|uniref:hypothetical protein n=1 Tax=Candidatus Solirubrobacter pratensis TaxID=1298857 RepID=UPI0003FE5C3D|nr:hypothetical protein [Candidatus Solirubrobacter pratensis]